jgi:hypothetical protein
MVLNQFEQYIIDNQDKYWHYMMLSLNPNITLEIIQANPDKH